MRDLGFFLKIFYHTFILITAMQETGKNIGEIWHSYATFFTLFNEKIPVRGKSQTHDLWIMKGKIYFCATDAAPSLHVRMPGLELNVQTRFYVPGERGKNLSD